jgi:SagB-type dehydrogenase family enzyme
MSLSEDALQYVNWLDQYHQATKYSESVRPHDADPALRPSPLRVFEQLARLDLPTELLSADEVATVSLLAHRLDAVPEREANPPHDLRTLATWLYMAYGFTHASGDGQGREWHRAAPSAGSTFPCEIYVAALAIEGLESGLYHFSPREFSLRKLRGADETFALLVRAGANPEALRRTTGALLVSTIFCRSTWRFGDRGFRMALLDAGHLTENLVVAADGLGVDTLVNLRLDDAATRELIGLEIEAPFAAAEAVQSMVVWTNPSARLFSPHAPPARLPPIARAPLATDAIEYAAVVGAQQICQSAGGLVHAIRGPVADTSPLSEQIQTAAHPPAEPPHGGEGLSRTLRHRHSARGFVREPISHDHFLWLNDVSFRSTPYPPMQPHDPRAALVRPFWLINGVREMDSGIWYFEPATNRWACLARGEARMEAAYLCLEQQLAADAAAICFIAANVHLLMHLAGPDLYRLAHLEAGIVSQRIQLGAAALGLGACGIGTYFDDELRKFLGLAHTHWEILYATAVGRPDPAQSGVHVVAEGSFDWRG